MVYFCFCTSRPVQTLAMQQRPYRYVHKPGVKHLTQAKNVLLYLKETQEYGIHYSRDIARLGLRNQKLNTLYASSDSDSAGCCDTARPSSGNLILMNAGSGRQASTALCTTSRVISRYSGRQTSTALCIERNSCKYVARAST